MAQSEEKPADQPAAGGQNAVLQMIVTMADTTWRMFVPILGLLFIGIYLDKTRGLFPWCSLVGFAIGIALSTVLIRNQFKKGTKAQ